MLGALGTGMLGALATGMECWVHLFHFGTLIGTHCAVFECLGWSWSAIFTALKTCAKKNSSADVFETPMRVCEF